MTKNNPVALVTKKLLPDNFSPKDSNSEQFQKLVRYLDNLILFDFNKLLNILYRVDVSEKKVKKALSKNRNNIPAGQIIANLLIEREKQKIKLRAKYSKK